MAHIQYFDELIREYLLFRGFISTVKAFDAELKADKDKGFRVDKVVEQLIQYINAYDLNSLRDLWNHFDTILFSKLDHDMAQGARKLESSLYKLYLVNATVNNKPEKITDFFAKMTNELQTLPDWKEWFMLPYLKNAEETMPFAVHFTKHWQDTLMLSLHNFLSVVFQGARLPALCQYDEDGRRMRRLQEENAELRARLTHAPSFDSAKPPSVSVASQDVMDDFFVISPQSGAGSESSQGRTSKSTKSSSPLATRKHHGDEKHSSSKMRMHHHHQPTWSKHPVEGGVSKRSQSLDSRRAKHSPDKTDLLVLSQEKISWHKSSVTQVKLNSSGSVAASADSDSVLNIWCPNPNPKMGSSRRISGGTENLCWLSRDRLVVAGPHSVSLLDVVGPDHSAIWTLPVPHARILSVSCSYSETTIAATAVSMNKQTGNIIFIDVKTAKIEETFDTGSEIAHCSAWGPSGLLAGTTSGSVLSVSHSGYISLFQPRSSPVIGVEVLSDGGSCFVMTDDHKIGREPLVEGTKDNRWTGDVRPGACRGHGSRPFSVNQRGSLLLTACGPSPPNIYQIGNNGVDRVVAELGVNGSISSVDWVSANQFSTVVASYGRNISVSTILTP